MKLLLCVFSVMLAAPMAGERPESYLPRGSVAAKVMELALPARAAELATKIQAAVAADAEWWREHIKKAVPGEPLPYDARLGLTAAEYQEYLTLAAAPVLQQAGRLELTFDWVTRSTVVVTANDPALEMGTLQLDLSRDQVETSYGVLAQRSKVDNTSAHSPTGPWRGFAWRLEKGDDDFREAVAANLSVGRLERTGEGILYFDAKQAKDRRVVRQTNIILLYPLEP